MKLLFPVSLLFVSATGFSGQDSGGGAGKPLLVSPEIMMALEDNLYNETFIHFESIGERVKPLQDFQTSKGQRGIIVEDETGIPKILLEKLED